MTPYKGLCIVVCLLNGHLSQDPASKKPCDFRPIKIHHIFEKNSLHFEQKTTNLVSYEGAPYESSRLHIR